MFSRVSCLKAKDSQVLSISLKIKSEKNFVSVQPTKPLLTSGDYSFCLRSKIQTWGKNILVNSSTFALHLNDYLQGNGRVFNGQKGHYFTWKNSLQLSQMPWNSFCVSFSSSNLNLIFTINENVIFNLFEENNFAFELNTLTIIYLATGEFVGKLSDFNVWSRALSLQEMKEFSNGCDSGFVERPNPDVVSWPTANISISGSYITMSNGSICNQNQKNFLLFNYYPRYGQGSKQCQLLNGETFYPKTALVLDDFLEKIKESDITTKCSNRFWVPFVRSTENEAVWVYKRKNYPDTEMDLATWNKVGSKENQTSMDCMLFQSQEKQYYEAECNEKLCSFCELDDSRLLFNLQTECNDQEQIDLKYFLSPDSQPYFFAGVSETSKLSAIWPTYSKIISGQKTSADFKGFPPLGIHTWSTSFMCDQKNVTQMKLNNVSRLIIQS
jgi:hypothetical protein